MAMLCVMALASACSIKEDRNQCPATLTVVMTPAAVLRAGMEACPLRVTDRVASFKAELDGLRPRAEFKVAKDTVRVCCWLPKPLNYPGATVYTIEYGKQCDSLWAYSHAFVASGEEISDSVTLHKRFLTLTVEYNLREGGEMPYDMQIVSTTAGTELLTHKPVAGNFQYALDFGGDKRSSVRLPMQGEPGELRLLLSEKGQDTPADSFPLGEELSGRLGYDWYAADLADVTIEVDFAKFEYSLAILPWEDGGNDDKIL